MTDTSYERWVADAVEAFSLDERAGVRPLRGGTANVSFVLDAAEPVIVTFFPDLSVQRIERLARLLEHLGQHGFPTNRILRSGKGDLLHVIDGVPVVVKAFLEGKALSTVDATGASRIGRVLARLHAVPVPAELGADHAMNREAMARMAEDAEDSSFSDWLGTAVGALPEVWGELPTGLVHGDLVPDNLIEAPDGSLIPIDFEEACRYPLVFDVGMSLVGLAIGDSLTPRTAAALVAGYEAGRELTPPERELVPAMVEYASAITACWRYDYGHREGPPPGELRDWRRMQANHSLSLEWRGSGVWATVLGT